MSEYPTDEASMGTRWVRRRSRLPVVLATAILAYLVMALAPIVQVASHGLSVVLFFSASFVVYLGLARFVWRGDPRPVRALVVAAAIYLAVGALGVLALGLGMVPGGSVLFEPWDPLHGFVTIFFWPTMWLWFYGCGLPILTVCPG